MFADGFPYPHESNSAYRFMLRLPALVSDLLMGLLIFSCARRYISHRHAMFVLAAFVFNGAIIFDSAYYGQVDAVHSLLALTAFVLVDHKRPAWGWAVMGLALMTKPQTYVLGPLLLLITWRRFGFKKVIFSGCIGALSCIMVALPFILHGSFHELLTYMLNIAEVHPLVGCNADNLWWWVTHGKAIMIPDSETVSILGQLGITLSYRTTGLLLLFLLLGPIWYQTWKHPFSPGIYVGAALSVLAFFVVSTQMHENYLYLALPFLAMVCYRNKQLAWLYFLLSLSFVSNMALHYPDFVEFLAPNNPDLFGGAELFWPRYVTSLVNTGALIFAFFPRMFWSGEPYPVARGNSA